MWPFKICDSCDAPGVILNKFTNLFENLFKNVL